ncbi:MAG: energy-coupling factor ABC transporter permease [Halobacteriota archaeon]
MVHISDGILSLPVLAAGWAITIALIAIALWWSDKKSNVVEEIPKASVMTPAFFVAHPAHFFALVLQAVLFQTTKKATSNGLGNVCYLKRNI